MNLPGVMNIWHIFKALTPCMIIFQKHSIHLYHAPGNPVVHGKNINVVTDQRYVKIQQLDKDIPVVVSVVLMDCDGPTGEQVASTELNFYEITHEKYNTYTLVLEFACNLYSDNRGTKLWRKLENGKLKVTFRVPK